MDAQDAVGAAPKKHVASPKQAAAELIKSEATTATATKPPLNPKSPPPQDDDGGTDASSEAETIVLAGKGITSPSKSRKSISAPRERAPSVDASHKKKRLNAHEKPKSKPGRPGVPLKSAPNSPPPANSVSEPRRRRLSTARSAPSDSESMRAHSPKPSQKDGSKSTDKLVPHKRKAPRAESEDEVATKRKALHGPGGPSRNPSTKVHQDSQASRTRSISPSRQHRRSISTQLPSQASNGLSHKKKRIPAPLRSTDYHSDDSSQGGSPRIRSSKLRVLTTPAAADSNMSPAKLQPHKKHLDAHGQTFLARACAKGEYEVAKQRLAERPEDLNIADFAGNTPLQIASINGFDEIVKLLLDAGCALDCVNNDRDTPLLDAVENGHLEVVKLLLDAGVNPRKANLNGEEPLDLITEETDNADEIRKLLIEARQRVGDRRRPSEEHHSRHQDGRDSHGPESPRRSPATTNPQLGSAARRGAAVRATKTSNHLLYMPLDIKTLRHAAGRGDEETVTRILQVMNDFDDPEAMVAAARGGHEMTLNLLLALGNANPDPPSVSSLPAETSTPMLAAIGQENIKVVELLLAQPNFDPTRRFRGETYFEIAKRRQGPNWVDEEHMLKEAYDKYKRSRKDPSKTKSPSAGRKVDKEAKRATARSETRDEQQRSHKRKLSSPSREPKEAKKAASAKVPTSPREKRRSESATRQKDDQTSPKRGPGRPKKDDRVPAIAVSDREASPANLKQPCKPKRPDPDAAGVSSEGETAKPRRKLVSGKDLKGEREKQRRASMVSTTSSLREPSSPRESRDEPADKPKAEKFLDRTKQLKRDESRDRLSVSSEGSGKRHRSSATPPHATSDKDGDAPAKRRRLDVDGKDKRPKPAVSDDRQDKSSLSREASGKVRKDREDSASREAPRPKKPADAPAERGRKESEKPAVARVKAEDVDVEMRDVAPVAPEPPAVESKQPRQKTQAELEAEAEAEARRQEEEEDMRIAEEEKRKQQEERERRRRDEEDRRKREAELKRKAEQEEQERKRKEAEERERQAAEEKKRKDAEAEALRKRQEEEDRIRREEEDKRRKAEEDAKKLREEEEARRRQEEEERRQREEQERLRKEQLEKEAAELARKKREEEEERKEQEKLREIERRRAQREAELRRQHAEAEKERLSKLPPLLQWLDGFQQPFTADIAQKFSVMQGVRYDCIDPEATGTEQGREQWILNTQVALLLGEKDLTLSRWTGWEKVPVSKMAKFIIWRIEADRYSLTTPSLYDLGRQLPGYYGADDVDRLPYRSIEALRREASHKFMATDMFFVKVSELMYIVPTIPHLRNVKLTVAYRELPENESRKWQSCQKWKIDPDANRFYGFAPGNKYYVNGALVHEQKPGLSAASKTPFPEHRAPRRGLTIVSPDDPDYTRLCREQGLEHLLNGTPSASPLLTNGSFPSPKTIVERSGRPGSSGEGVNGGSDQTSSPLVNGHGHHDASMISPTMITAPNPLHKAEEIRQHRTLVNGVNGTTANGSGSSPT